MSTLATAPAATATDRRALGPAWHRKVDGIHVLKLKGSIYEMARQHGALLRDAVPNGPLPYYRVYLEKVLRNAGLGRLAGPARRLLAATVGRRLVKGLPDFAAQAVRGIADGSEIPHREVLEGCVMPEGLLWLVTRELRMLRVGPATAHRLALGLGCSSAIAWGEATVDGKLLHARNFDFHGVASWPRETAVVFHEPDEGQPYVSVSSAGIPMGGIQAMNASGLSLAVHQHMFSDQTRLGGIPAGIMGDEVMRRATNLDEARAILEPYTPVGCFTYLVTDAKTREVLCLEESPARKAVFRTGPGDATFGYANIYLDPELGATECNFYPSYWRHNQGRHGRLRELLDAQRGTLDPSGMASIIADTGDDGCRIRRSIAMLMTVASVVFSPEDGVLWVSQGETPTSHGRFRPFSLAGEDHDPERGELQPDVDTSAREAFDCYRRGYLAFFDGDDLSETRRQLDRARELQPRQPLYHGMAGLAALRSGDAAGAEDRFDAALASGHPDPERMATFHLWRAFARDRQGRRAAAVEDYSFVMSAPAVDPAVRKAAERGTRRVYSARRSRRLALEFAFADVIQP